MEEKTIELIRKILKNYHAENLRILTKLLKRIIALEEKFETLEHNQAWNEQTLNWQEQDLKSLKEAVETLEQTLSSLKTEMIFENP